MGHKNYQISLCVWYLNKRFNFNKRRVKFIREEEPKVISVSYDIINNTNIKIKYLFYIE